MKLSQSAWKLSILAIGLMIIAVIIFPAVYVTKNKQAAAMAESELDLYQAAEDFSYGPGAADGGAEGSNPCPPNSGSGKGGSGKGGSGKGTDGAASGSSGKGGSGKGGSGKGGSGKGGSGKGGSGKGGSGKGADGAASGASGKGASGKGSPGEGSEGPGKGGSGKGSSGGSSEGGMEEGNGGYEYNYNYGAVCGRTSCFKRWLESSISSTFFCSSSLSA
jgi:hypothetical protein